MNICRWCQDETIILGWELNQVPYGDLYENDREIARQTTLRSVTLSECVACDLLQLSETPDPPALYGHYLYRTSLTPGLKDFYQDISENLILKAGDIKVVVDIGSNDGTFLQNFHERGCFILGIEPSKNLAEVSTNKGIKTINTFFTSAAVQEILDVLPKKTDLVSINYTLANVADLYDCFIGIDSILAENGYLSIVTGYHPDQFALGMFEYINHDHLTYLKVKNFLNMFHAFNLSIISIELTEHKGGSIHIVARKGKHSETPRVKSILQREIWKWPSNHSGVLQLRENIFSAKEKIHNFLSQSEDKILGVGASISSTHLLYEFELFNYVDALVDDNPAKIGKFSPGSALEVLPFKEEQLKNYERALILSWQHTTVLIDRLKSSGFSGTVVVPLPNFVSLQI